jgi:hypothetical protein
MEPTKLGSIYMELISACCLLPKIAVAKVRERIASERSRVLFPALPDFLRSSASATGSTQPREYN